MRKIISDKIYSYLELKSADVKILIRNGILSFFLGVLIASFEIITIGIFLNRNTSESLPYIFIFSGVIGLVYIALSYFFRKNNVFLSKIPPIIAACIVIFAFVIEYFFNAKPIIHYLPVALSLPLSIYILKFNGFVYKRHMPIKSLRKTEWLLEFSLIAGIATSSYLLLGLMFLDLSPLTLFTIPLTASIIAFIIYSKIRKITPSAPHSPKYSKTKNIIFNDYEKPFAKILLMLISFSGIIFVFVQFGFLSTVQQTFNNSIGYIKFLGLFTGSVYLFLFFSKHFLIRKLLFSYETPYSAILAPLINSISLIIFIVALYVLGLDENTSRFAIFFMGFMLFKLIYSATNETIEKTSIFLIAKVFNTRLQQLFENNIYHFLIHFGILLSGLFVLALTHFIPGKIYVILPSLIAFSVIQLILTYKTLKEYRVALKEYILSKAHKKGNPLQKYLPLKERLYKLNIHKSVKDIIYSLNLAEELFPGDFKNALKHVINNNDPNIISYSINKIYAHKIIDNEEFIDKIHGRLSNPDDIGKILALKEYYSLKVKSNISPEKIDALSHSKFVQERILAANLISLTNEDKLVYTLTLLLKDYESEVKKAALKTAAIYKRKYLLPVITEFFIRGPYIHLAYEALIKYGSDTVDYLEQFFLDKHLDEIQLLRIIQLYKEIGGKKAQEIIIQKLDNPSGEITYRAIQALKKSGFKITRKHINKFLFVIAKYAQILATNYNVLATLHNHKTYLKITDAVEKDIRFNTRILYSLLSIVYGAELIQHIQELSEKDDTANNGFAIELIDEIIDENIKPIIIPLIHLQRNAKRISDLEHYFPLESMNAAEALNEIITSESRYFSNWTKIICLSEVKEQEILESYALKSHIFHSNPALREAASKALYNYSITDFENTIERTGRDMSGLIRANVLESNMYSFTNTIEFLQQNIHLNKLSTAQLMWFAQHLNSSNEEILSDEFLNFIVKKPVIIFKNNDFLIDIKGERITFSSDVVIFDLEMIGDMNNITKFKTGSELTFYFLDKETLRKVIFDLPELGVIMQKIVEEIYSFNPQLPENFYNYTHQKSADALMLSED